MGFFQKFSLLGMILVDRIIYYKAHLCFSLLSSLGETRLIQNVSGQRVFWKILVITAGNFSPQEPKDVTLKI